MNVQLRAPTSAEVVENKYFGPCQNKAAAAAINWVKQTGGAHSLLPPMLSISFLLCYFPPGKAAGFHDWPFLVAQRTWSFCPLTNLSKPCIVLLWMEATSSSGAVLGHSELWMGWVISHRCPPAQSSHARCTAEHQTVSTSNGSQSSTNPMPFTAY